MNRHGAVLINGARAGELVEVDDGYSFAYDRDYLAHTHAQPVSLTLPLRVEPYHGRHLFPFFAGLLSEGALADLQCRMLRIDERDLFGRLLETCRDTVGAVTIEPLP
ncbi:MAG: HipA N-terminal domain-containing protein [Planctomycetes bacterium]|nr:HipA N-terminal domain-containing protein [Planctomycetota bacterium]